MTEREKREACARTFEHQRLALRSAVLNLLANGWNALPVLGKRFPTDWAPDGCPRCGAELP